MTAPVQLRIYTIAEGALDEFVDRWTRGVRPLRERHGFTVDGAWVMPEQNRFVWLLSYGGPGSFQDADAAYVATNHPESPVANTVAPCTMPIT